MHGKTMVSYTRGSDYAFTVGLIENTTYEDAYPSAEINTPAGGLYEYIDGVAYGSNDTAALISVSSLYSTTDSASSLTFTSSNRAMSNSGAQT